jgi:hypothetical protein
MSPVTSRTVAVRDTLVLAANVTEAVVPSPIRAHRLSMTPLPLAVDSADETRVQPDGVPGVGSAEEPPSEWQCSSSPFVAEDVPGRATVTAVLLPADDTPSCPETRDVIRSG